MIVPCYGCSCPVEFDVSNKLEEMTGITYADLIKHNLHIVCNLCADLLDVDGNYKTEVKTKEEFVDWLKGVTHHA